MSKTKTTVRNICTGINWVTTLLANDLIAAPLLPALINSFFYNCAQPRNATPLSYNCVPGDLAGHTFH